MFDRARIGALVVVATLAAACSEPAPPPAAPAAHRTWDATAFYTTISHRMTPRGAKAFSPDGTSILYASDQTGVFNVYSVPVAGGEPTALTQSTTDSTFAISWFPNDGRILFAADQGGNELTHIYVRETSGETRDLTPGDKLKADFLGWSADGSTFWLTSNERDPQWFDVYAYDAATYARRVIFTNTGYTIGAISPLGTQLALTRSNASADEDLFLVDLSKPRAPVRQINTDTADVSYRVFGFSADGASLLYATNAFGEFDQAWRYTLADGAAAAAVTGDWDVMTAGESPTGRYLVSALNVDASTEATVTEQATGAKVELKNVPAGDLGGLSFSSDEARLAFTVASDTSPADIYVADLATGEARRLTRSLPAEIDQSMLVDATIVRYPSFDGLPIPGVLYKPRTASPDAKVPAIVLVHGGPGGQSRRGYSAQTQHLVNHGYAVFAANNRGSSGYGKTFFHMDDKRHGDVDLQDIVYARKYLETLDWVDGERVGVMGGSYGGYITAAALAFQPDAFDVGINIFGVTNWVRTLKSIPPWWGADRVRLFDELGDPATDEERLRSISPLFHAKNISKPMLVVQGANDPRVLQVESDEIVAAVRANGVPVEYVLFPDEGHGFQKRANRIAASEAYLRFLDQHLKGQTVE